MDDYRVINLKDILRIKTFLYYQYKNNFNYPYYDSESYKEVDYDENIINNYGDNFLFETKYKDVKVIYAIYFNKVNNWINVKDKEDLYPEPILVLDKKNTEFNNFNTFDNSKISVNYSSNIDTYGKTKIYLINDEEYKKYTSILLYGQKDIKFNKKGLTDNNLELFIFYHPKYYSSKNIRGVKYLSNYSLDGIREEVRFRFSL